MRIAALIIGILGASSLFSAGVWGAFLGMLGNDNDLVLISYGVPLAALIGACLAIQYPGLAALLLLGSAGIFFSMFGFGTIQVSFGGLAAVAGFLALLGTVERRTRSE